MRLLHTFSNEKHALAFHVLLESKKIENELEIQSDNDWGSASYGDVRSRIWIFDEDQFESAEMWLAHFLKNPDDASFYEFKQTQQRSKPPIFNETTNPVRPVKALSAAASGAATMYLILACVLLFVLGSGPMRPVRMPPVNIPITPLYASSVKKALMFDYPKAYDILDRFVNLFGVEALFAPQELPQEGKLLLQQFAKTPFWNGFYDKVVAYLKTPSAPITIQAELFEKIREGQIWRLFSPALLHNDLFHLFFNMIWLLVLGKQMENRMGIPKYLLFILITGVISNICQYLVSGSNFIGFSGVLCGMILFIWIRQKKTPWEGYQLLPATMGFITLFVVAMAGLQGISFVLEIFGKSSISPPIANTAHLTGAFSGYLLAQTDFFRWKSSK